MIRRIAFAIVTLVISFCAISAQDVSGTIDGHDYVDLGLPSGTLWATCNVGANSPEQYGNYYAWGETQTKSIYILKSARKSSKKT